jgi:hypothetical protein
LIPYLIGQARPVGGRLLLALTLSLVPSGGGVLAQVLGDPVDVSQEFQKPEQAYFVGSRVRSFDPATGLGTLQWDRYLRGSPAGYALRGDPLRGRVKWQVTRFPAR